MKFNDSDFITVNWILSPFYYLGMLLPLSIKFNLLYLVPIGFFMHAIIFAYGLRILIKNGK